MRNALAFLHSLGKQLFSKKFLNVIYIGFDIEDSQTFIMLIDIT